MTSRNFLESEEMSCLQRENKKPTFYALHLQYQRVYSVPVKGYIQYQVTNRYIQYQSKGIFSTNGYIQYQRVYSAQKGIFSIKGYIQYQRVYSVPKGIFSTKGYIQHQRVYSVPIGIFSIKGYIQYQRVYSVSKGILHIYMVYRKTILSVNLKVLYSLRIGTIGTIGTKPKVSESLVVWYCQINVFGVVYKYKWPHLNCICKVCYHYVTLSGKIFFSRLYTYRYIWS